MMRRSTEDFKDTITTMQGVSNRLDQSLIISKRLHRFYKNRSYVDSNKIFSQIKCLAA